MSRRRTTGLVAGVLSVGAVAAAVTVLNLPDARSSQQPSGELPAQTAEITKGTLIDGETHDGTLGHGETTPFAARTAGTVTRLPATGAIVTRGKPLYRIDNKPVTLLYGSMPAYRTLTSGVEGADVRQLERNLRALGYGGFTVDDKFTAATADAVEQWQDDLDLTETGRVETSQVEYAPAAVRIDSKSLAVGAIVQPGTELLKVTGTHSVVVVDLEIDAQRLARKGAQVEVQLPDGSTTKGRITDVETIVKAGQGGEEDTTLVEVTISFSGPPKGLDKASVSVDFTASRRENVLSVPVTALLALAEGGYGVQVLENGAARMVAVETGLFADGRVEITGDGLRPGMKVGLPS
jgi:peptidoglycan hydrolase-like protein with peptidoglycan-binding domain